jgi:predicted HD phosphohydrolase
VQRAKYVDSPCYQSWVDFCERRNQSSFDPDYPSTRWRASPTRCAQSSRKPYDEAVVQAGVVKGLP